MKVGVCTHCGANPCRCVVPNTGERADGAGENRLMGALGTLLRNQEGGRLAFWCPGCNDSHTIVVGSGRWTWDGNVERPTFSPSVLVKSGHYASHFNAASDTCWCSYYKEHPEEHDGFSCGICHSFVKDGRIQFLADCTHALAGQTVDLPPWPNYETEQAAADAKFTGTSGDSGSRGHAPKVTL